MDEELVSESPSEGQRGALEERPSFAYIFNECFPYYLTLGMSYEEYWKLDCTLTVSYREAYKLKRKRENENMWVQGMYFASALGTIAGEKYVQEPFPLSREEIEERKMLKMKSYFETQSQLITKKLEEKNG